MSDESWRETNQDRLHRHSLYVINSLEDVLDEDYPCESLSRQTKVYREYDILSEAS